MVVHWSRKDMLFRKRRGSRLNKSGSSIAGSKCLRYQLSRYDNIPRNDEVKLHEYQVKRMLRRYLYVHYLFSSG